MSNDRRNKELKQGPRKEDPPPKKKNKLQQNKIIEQKHKPKKNTKSRRARRSCHREVAIYCPHAGLAYCVFLHSSNGSLCVEGLCVTWLLPVGVR